MNPGYLKASKLVFWFSMFKYALFPLGHLSGSHHFIPLVKAETSSLNSRLLLSVDDLTYPLGCLTDV